MTDQSNDQNIGSVRDGSSSGLTDGAKIAIGIGVPLGVLGVAGLLLIWWFMRRRRSQRSGHEAVASGFPRDDDPKIVVASAEPISHETKPTSVKAWDNSASELSNTPAVVPAAMAAASRQHGELGSDNTGPPPGSQSELSADVPRVELGHTSRTVDGGYSDLPERDTTNDYSSLPEYAGSAHQSGSGQSDPILAQIEEDERQLEERQRRLYEMERLDNERRELQRRREQRMRELR